MENKEKTKCFSCGENELVLSENELVYECLNCGYWTYSSS